MPEIIQNALPEALGGLMAAGILALLAYLVTWLRDHGHSATDEKKRQLLRRLLLWVIGGIVALVLIIYLIINNSSSSPQSPTNTPKLENRGTATPVAIILPTPTPVPPLCIWRQVKIQDTENQGVPFYSTPIKDNSLVQRYLSNGEEFEVIGCNEESDGLLLLYLQNESGTGWVESTYVIDN